MFGQFDINNSYEIVGIETDIEKLKTFLKGNKHFNGDVYEFTLRQGYLPKHTNEIFEQWQTQNILNVFLADGSKARKKSFYIKYFKSSSPDNKKVYFELK